MSSTQLVQPAYYEKALQAFADGEFKEAAVICEEAATTLEERTKFQDASVACDLLGTAYYRLGALPEAKSSYLKSLELADRAGGTTDSEYAKTFNSLAAVSNAMGNQEEAMKLLLKSLRINENCQAKTGMISTCHQLGVVEHSRLNLEEARRWYSKAISLADAKHDFERLIAAVRCLASTMSDDDEVDDVNKIYSIATDAMDVNGDIESTRDAAEQARREFDFRASTEFYRKALEMAEKQMRTSCSFWGLVKGVFTKREFKGRG